MDKVGCAAGQPSYTRQLSMAKQFLEMYRDNCTFSLVFHVRLVEKLGLLIVGQLTPITKYVLLGKVSKIKSMEFSIIKWGKWV